MWYIRGQFGIKFLLTQYLELFCQLLVARNGLIEYSPFKGSQNLWRCNFLTCETSEYSLKEGIFQRFRRNCFQFNMSCNHAKTFIFKFLFICTPLIPVSCLVCMAKPVVKTWTITPQFIIAWKSVGIEINGKERANNILYCYYFCM